MAKSNDPLVVHQDTLRQIVESYPVAAGDLISKEARSILKDEGFVEYREGNRKLTNVTDGERLGGWVPTEEGIAYYEAQGLESPWEERVQRWRKGRR